MKGRAIVAILGVILIASGLYFFATASGSVQQVVQNCANGATNPPLCTYFTCSNGATNPPFCNNNQNCTTPAPNACTSNCYNGSTLPLCGGCIVSGGAIYGGCSGVVNVTSMIAGTGPAIFTASTASGTFTPSYPFFFGNITTIPTSAIVTSVQVLISHVEPQFSPYCYMQLSVFAVGMPTPVPVTPAQPRYDVAPYQFPTSPNATTTSTVEIGQYVQNQAVLNGWGNLSFWGSAIPARGYLDPYSWYRLLGPQPQVTTIPNYVPGFNLPYTSSFRLAMFYEIHNTLTNQVCVSKLYSLKLSVKYSTGTVPGSVFPVYLGPPIIAFPYALIGGGILLLVFAALQKRPRPAPTGYR